MMERITCRLIEAGIPTITLYAEPSVVGLYERLGENPSHSCIQMVQTAFRPLTLIFCITGFIRDPDGVRGMAFQRQKKEKQQLASSR